MEKELIDIIIEFNYSMEQMAEEIKYLRMIRDNLIT